MYSVKRLFIPIINKLLSHLEPYPLYDKIYKVGSYIVIGYFISMFLAMFFFQDYINPDDVVGTFAYLLMGTFTAAVVIEYFTLIKGLFEKIWFKTIMGVIAILVYKLASIHTDHIINDLTGVDPSLLSNASSTLVSISLIYIWLLIIAAIMGVYIIFFGFIFTGENKTEDNDLPIWKIIGRSIGLIVVFGFLLSTINKLQAKESIMNDFSKGIILATEYFPKSHCKQGNNGKLLYAGLSRGYVSIYDMDTEKFYIEKCER